MNAWLHVTGFGALILLLLGVWLCKQADRPGDDFGAAYPGLLALALALLFFVAWIALLVVKVYGAR